MRIQQNQKEIGDMTKKEMMREAMNRTSQIDAAVENVASQVEALYDAISDDPISQNERESIRNIIYEEIFIDAVNETIINPGAEEMSEKTLREVLSFMRSSSGAAFHSMMRRLGVDFMEEVQDDMDGALQKCFDELRD